MTARTYHTLCLWDVDHQSWFDSFGDYSKAEVKGESDTLFMPRGHKVIITHKDDAQSMMNARDALPPPRYPNAR